MKNKHKSKTRINVNFVGNFMMTPNNKQAGILSQLLSSALLEEMVHYQLQLTQHSLTISEINGDCVFSVLKSSWCKLLATVCQRNDKTNDNTDKINNGFGFCHESCCKHVSANTTKKLQPIDIECACGLWLYALPIINENNALGTISITYGNPPVEKRKLNEIALQFKLSYEELEKVASSFQTIPLQQYELAKNQLQQTVQLIEERIYRKHAEIKLAEVNQQYNAHLSSIPIGIFRTTAKGKPVHINHSLANMLGFASPDDAIAYYHDLAKQLYANPQRRIEFIQLIKKNKEVVNFKYEAKRVDGKTIWLTMNAKIVAGAKQTDFFIDGYTIDITHQVQSDQKLFELNNELIDQNIEYFKLNEKLQKSIKEIQDINIDLEHAKNKAEESDRLKSFFLANMSHEIRTPMNSIMGFASLLPDEESKELISKYANIIVNSSEQLVRIIDDIVLYSKLQTKLITCKRDRFDVFKMLDIIEQSFDLPIYNKQVKLVVNKTSNQELFANTDYDIIRQIITNLVSNSFKYTNEGEINIGCVFRYNALVFYVKDTGIGIPQKEFSLIFNRFYRGSNTLQNENGGTGLGLSIVAELVQLLKGEINVESEIGKGTTFEITIPQ